MKPIRQIIYSLCIGALLPGCGKKSSSPPVPPPTPDPLTLNAWSVNGVSALTSYFSVSRTPVIRFNFSSPVNRATTASGILFSEIAGTPVNINITYEHADSVVVVQPVQSINFLTRYTVSVTSSLKSSKGSTLNTPSDISLFTLLDSTDKFPVIPDDSLLSLVQKQTFSYFHDFAHPVSGMARERNTSGDVVTTGGTGFGIMATLAAINRSFITRAEGLSMVQKIVGFLKNTAPRFHGAFSHWMNGITGTVVPFASNDDGADLVET